MSEIWNLSALCRCCHKDGHFKSLQAPHKSEDSVEIYANLLCDTFGITIVPPPIDASYSICDECIRLLQQATCFKRQVLACERNFQEYCKNEEMSHTDFIKVEMDSVGNDSDIDNKSLVNFVEEYEVELKSNDIKLKMNSIGKIKSEAVIDCPGRAATSDHKPTPEDRKADKNPVKKRKPIKSKPTSRRKIKTESVEVFVTESGDNISCKLCDSKHKDKQTLRAHMKNFHSNRDSVYRCEHCHQEFDRQYLFVQHMKESHNDRPFKCSYCGNKFLSKASLQYHENTHTKQTKFTCDLCNKQFAYKQTLRKHFSWHNGTNKKYVCDMCGHSFNDQTNLAIHIRTVHEKLRLFHCTMCKKSFAAKKNLKIHLRNHTGERPYQCDICPSSFTCSTKMKLHKQIHEDKMRYTCVVCSSVYSDRYKFKRHVRSHVGSLPHKCHMCSKDFSCKYSLKRHVNEHFGIKAFECSICLKKFTQKTQLNRHMANIHNPNKSLLVKIKTKCEICKQNVADMERHKKTHIVRPFSCHLCDKTYPVNNALTRHIKSIHLEKKSHSCAECGKRYTHKKSLMTHKMKVHACVLKTEDEDDFNAAVTAYAIANKKVG